MKWEESAGSPCYLQISQSRFLGTGWQLETHFSFTHVPNEFPQVHWQWLLEQPFTLHVPRHLWCSLTQYCAAQRSHSRDTVPAELASAVVQLASATSAASKKGSNSFLLGFRII